MEGSFEQLIARIQEEPLLYSLLQALFAEYDRYFHYANIEHLRSAACCQMGGA